MRTNNVNFNGKFAIDVSRINEEHIKNGLNRFVQSIENKYKGTVVADFANNQYHCNDTVDCQ